MYQPVHGGFQGNPKDFRYVFQRSVYRFLRILKNFQIIQESLNDFKNFSQIFPDIKIFFEDLKFKKFQDF